MQLPSLDLLKPEIHQREMKKDIELVEERHSFEKRELRIHKIFGVCMVLFLTAGLLGLFGDGMVSSQKIEASEYEITYDRFVRNESPTELFVHLENAEKTTTISFNEAYTEKVEIKNIVPSPASVQIKNGLLVLNFNTSREGVIIFYLWPIESGSAELELSVQDDINYLSQYVFI